MSAALPDQVGTALAGFSSITRYRISISSAAC